jgi:uncharacterized protein (DUF169 family)
MADFLEKVDQWRDILKRLNFEIRPTAVKFFTKQPHNIGRLAERMFFCEMLKFSQEGNSFYADPKNHMCDAGLYLIGGGDAPLPYTNGEYGAGLKVFNETRAARRIYQYIPKLEKGTVQYVAFSSLDRLSFEPDLLILVGNVEQTEILLRAMSYNTGKMWVSRFTSVMGCAWIFIYPYLTGEFNYGVTGLSFGMKAKKVLPQGLQIISIPYDMLPTVLENLKDMPWVLPFFQSDGPEFRKRLRIELGLDPSH